MFSWLDGLLTVIVDRTPEELMGAILLGLLLSAALAPLAVWIGRSRRDQMARMTGLMLVLAVVSMLVSGTFVQAQIDSKLAPSMPNPGEFQFPKVVPPPDYVWLVAVIDENADGHVDPEELRQAATALGTDNRLTSYRPHAPWGGWPRGGDADRHRDGWGDRRGQDSRDSRREGSSRLPDSGPPTRSAHELLP